MKQTRFIMFTLCALLLMLVACTQKDNLTGTSDSGLRPETAILDQSYRLDAFCYQDTAINKGSVGSFSVGMHNDLQAVGLIYFDEMPDSIECVETGLRLVMEARHGAAGQTIRLARVLQPWDETECDWTYAGEDTLWEEPRWEALDGARRRLPTPTPSFCPAHLAGAELDRRRHAQLRSGHLHRGTRYLAVLFLRSRRKQSQAHHPLYQRRQPCRVRPLCQRRRVHQQRRAGKRAAGGKHPVQCDAHAAVYEVDLSLQALQAVTGITDTLEIRQTTINRAEVVIPVDEALSFIPEDTFTAYAYRLKSESALDSLPVAATSYWHTATPT
jgi:hypothetical protein